MSAGPAPLAGNALSTGRLRGAGRSRLPGIAGVGRDRPRESGAHPPGVLRHRIRPGRGSRPAGGCLGGGAHGRAAESDLRAGTRWRQHGAALWIPTDGTAKSPASVREWKTCATAGRRGPTCTSAWDCRSRSSAGRSGPHGAGLLVTGGSREALLAAESECPVLYVGPAPPNADAGRGIRREEGVVAAESMDLVEDVRPEAPRRSMQEWLAAPSK